MGALILADSPLSVEYSLLAALRKESKKLAERITDLQDDIEEFNLEYYKRFSKLLYDIFTLEKELGYQSAQQKLNMLNEYSKDNDCKDKSKPELDLDTRIKLKQLYRSTARKLHPDKHPPELTKEESHQLMQKLNEAYERQDFYAVKQISETWAKGYRGETKQEILEQIERLQSTIKRQKEIIEELLSSKEYKNLITAQKNISWWDSEKKSLIEKLNFLTAQQILGVA